MAVAFGTGARRRAAFVPRPRPTGRRRHQLRRCLHIRIPGHRRSSRVRPAVADARRCACAHDRSLVRGDQVKVMILTSAALMMPRRGEHRADGMATISTTLLGSAAAATLRRSTPRPCHRRAGIPGTVTQAALLDRERTSHDAHARAISVVRLGDGRSPCSSLMKRDDLRTDTGTLTGG